jgi:FG-GAP repeat protein
MALSLAGERAAAGAGELSGRLPAGKIAVVRPGKAPWSHTAERLATGAVYVFQRHENTWSEEARLVGGGAGFGSRFGSAVALDGDRLAVGAPGEGEETGAVYVFRRDARGWREETRLLPEEGLRRSSYGRAVALRGDTLAVGTGSGRRVDLFRRRASGWQKEATLDDPAPVAGTGFGLALSLRPGELLVGAPPTDDSFPVPPAAYLFRREAGGWRQVARLDLGDQEGDFGFAREVILDTGTASVLGSRKVYRFRAEAEVWRRDGELELGPEVSPQVYARSLAADDSLVLMGASLWGATEGSADVAAVFEPPSAGRHAGSGGQP